MNDPEKPDRKATIQYTVDWVVRAVPRADAREETPATPTVGARSPTTWERLNGPLIAVVTTEDIERAKQDQSCRCPVQTTLSRIFSRTAVVAYETKWREDGSRVLVARATVGNRSWILPDGVLQFMRLFDQGQSVDEITFELPEAKP